MTMGKQNAAKIAENLKRRNITPVQVAFIVDRYLSDNYYTKTLSVFRTEAASVMSKAKAPKNLLSLSTILDEYISLKEQRVILDQEKCRVDALLNGIHNVMQAYNSSVPPVSVISESALPTVPATAPALNDSRFRSTTDSPLSHPTRVKPGSSVHCCQSPDPVRLSPSTNAVLRKSKRKEFRSSSTAPTAKRSRGPVSAGTQHSSELDCSNIQVADCHGHVQNKALKQDLSAQQLKKRSLLIQSDLSPHTPVQDTPSLNVESFSPSANSSQLDSATSISPSEISSVSCHFISSKTVVVSPIKKVGCASMGASPSLQKSPSKRSSKGDHVKARLDFTDSNESNCLEKLGDDVIPLTADTAGTDLFDLEFLNFDVFGADSCLSELLDDINLDGVGTSSGSLPVKSSSLCLTERSVKELVNGEVEPDLSVNEVLSELDMNRQCSDSLVAVKSVTKCIKLLSPAKTRASSLADQENN